MGKKEQWFRGCSYEHQLPNGAKLVGSSYLPEKLAKVGRKIYFESKDVLYVVTRVGRRRALSELQDRERDFLHQRRVSDV